jgi:hypothetical protein
MSDDIVLPSGRRVYANCGIIGIDADGAISQGFDGRIWVDGPANDDGPWTAEERAQLANIAIKRWQAFAGIEPRNDAELIDGIDPVYGDRRAP